jgi:hypothetical protein
MYHSEDDLCLRVVGLTNFIVGGLSAVHLVSKKERTFPPDPNHGPGRGRRLGGDLALIGLIKLSQSTSVARP